MKAVLSDSNGSSPKAYGLGGQDRRKKRKRAFRPFSARGDIKMERIKLWDSVPGSDGSVSPEQTPELLYFPCEGAKSCVAVFPGGGYAALCDDYEGTELAEWFTTVGVAAFVLRYRVLPYHYPCQIADAHRAIRYIRHNADRFGIDKDKIGAMGFSAGGHLVAATATVAHDPLEDPNDPIDAESAKLNAQILLRRFDILGVYTSGNDGKLSRRRRRRTEARVLPRTERDEGLHTSRVHLAHLCGSTCRCPQRARVCRGVQSGGRPVRTARFSGRRTRARNGEITALFGGTVARSAEKLADSDRFPRRLKTNGHHTDITYKTVSLQIQTQRTEHNSVRILCNKIPAAVPEG